MLDSSHRKAIPDSPQSKLSTTPIEAQESPSFEHDSISDSIQSALEEYSIQRTLGEGTFGRVVKVRHLKTGKKMALKIIQNIFECEQKARHVIREIQILRQLQKMKDSGSYPHTVGLLDLKLFHMTKGAIGVAIFMDYEKLCLKQLLGKVAKTKQLLAESSAVSLIYGLLCALNFMHSTGVVHRDIKPPNLLVTVTSGIKLCDFGFSRAMPSDSSAEQPCISKERKRGVVKTLEKRLDDRSKRERNLSPHVQTRFYRAPEVILFERSYTEKIDIWSTGVIAIQLAQCATEVYEDQESWMPFKGESCFPMSPGAKEKDFENDQLRLILQVLGKQNKYDTAFLTFKNQTEHIQNLQPDLDKVQMSEEYPGICSDFMRVVENMLELNPCFRYPSRELIKHKAFDKVRNPMMEKPAPFSIRITVDHEDLFSYNTQDNQYEYAHYFKILLKEVELQKA